MTRTPSLDRRDETTRTPRHRTAEENANHREWWDAKRTKDDCPERFLIGCTCPSCEDFRATGVRLLNRGR